MWSASALAAALTLVASYSSAQNLVIQKPTHPSAQFGQVHGSTSYKPGRLDGSTYNDELPDAHTLSETIVSTLSASNQHTTLLHLLQRSKCIPLLAHIGNATLFAPTDQAWIDYVDAHGPHTPEDPTYQGWLTAGGLEEWKMPEEEVLRVRIGEGGDEESERKKLDNQNWWLRQHLLYHMLNYTLSPEDLTDNITSDMVDGYKKDKKDGDERKLEVSMETTLLFPMLEEPPIPPTPPPGPPWLPRGGDGLLGGHGQRLRVLKGNKDDRGKVGVTHSGDEGVSIWDGSGWPPVDTNDTESFWPGSGKDKGDKGDDDDKHEEEKRRKKAEAGVIGSRWSRNGVVVGVEGVLEPPPSIHELIRTTPELHYLSRLLSSATPCPAPLPDDFETTPHLTIFAPSSGAFEGQFDDIERGYLEGGYGAEGVGRVVGGSVVLSVGRDQVGWSDTFRSKGSQVKSASGQNLSVESSSGGLSVDGNNATTIDILASNGVVHILPDLLLPENFTLLNSAEKVLLSVNATRFVSLLRDANISSKYVGEPGKEQDKSQAWTFLAPTDEVMDMMDRFGGHRGPPIPQVWKDALPQALTTESLFAGLTLPEPQPGPQPGPPPGEPPFKDASALASLLQYHILPGRYTTSDLKDGMLVGTELRTAALEGERQRLKVDVSASLDRSEWDNVGQGEIRFGGASVLGKPVRSGKSVIYLISSLLSPPDDVLQTAVSDLQLSTFIAAVYAADLERIVKHTPGITWFLPRNRACNALGLGMQYLLSAEGKDELRKVLRYHAVDGIVYSSDIEIGKTVHKTLEGGDIILDHTGGKNGTFTLSSPTKWEGHDSGESYPANGELRPAKVNALDALTDTGVIHTIDSLEMPADVSLTIAKLIRGSKQSTMLDLMARAGLDWVLQGREPTHEEVSRAELQGVVRTWAEDTDEPEEPNNGPDADSLAMPSYTVLCPSDSALSRINLTYYLSDRKALLDLLKLHIIPTQPSTPRTGRTKQAAEAPRDGQPLSLFDDLVYQTLLSSKSKYGEVAFRATGDNSFIVGIKNARGRGSIDGGGNDAARVGASGRASVRWKRNRQTEMLPSHPWNRLYSSARLDSAEEGDKSYDLWKGGLALGGGVLMIDNVLVPYEPSWFSRWGWLVITLVGLGVVVLVGGAIFAWWWMSRERDVKYEPLEGEEEE